MTLSDPGRRRGGLAPPGARESPRFENERPRGRPLLAGRGGTCVLDLQAELAVADLQGPGDALQVVDEHAGSRGGPGFRASVGAQSWGAPPTPLPGGPGHGGARPSHGHRGPRSPCFPLLVLLFPEASTAVDPARVQPRWERICVDPPGGRGWGGGGGCTVQPGARGAQCMRVRSLVQQQTPLGTGGDHGLHPPRAGRGTQDAPRPAAGTPHAAPCCPGPSPLRPSALRACTAP